MIRRAYAIFDKRAGDLANAQVLLLAGNENVAIRDFVEGVLAPNSHLARHPDDYSLVLLGTVVTTDEATEIEDACKFITLPSREVITARHVLMSQQPKDLEAAND